MRRSMQVPVEVDCEEMGLKKYPVAGYPLSYYKQNYNLRNAHKESRSRFPSTPIHVESYGSPIASYKIPKYRLNYVNKYVDIPFVQKIQKVVEIPEIREITKFVDKVKIVDVPVDDIRMVPKLKIREIEKVRHIPGPIQYIEVPQEHIVHNPIKQIVEKIHEIPVIEDIEVEVPIYVPTPIGPPEDINIDIPLPYDVPQFCYKPDLLKARNKNKFNCCTSMCQQKEPTFEIVNNRNQMYSSPPLGYNVIHMNKNEHKNHSNQRHNFNDERLFNYDRNIRNHSRNSNNNNNINSSNNNNNNNNNNNLRNSIRRNNENPERRDSHTNNSHFTFYPNENYQNRDTYFNRDNINDMNNHDNTYLEEDEPRNYNDEPNNYVYDDNRNYIYTNQYNNEEENDEENENHVTAELIVKQCNQNRH